MNTLTTKDVAQVVAARKPAYDFFGTDWAVSAEVHADNPVAAFGLGAVRTSRRAEGFGGLGAVRTSRRAEGFGDLGAVRTSRRAEGFGDALGLGFLDTQILGIPVWVVGVGAFLALGGLKILGGRKK